MSDSYLPIDQCKDGYLYRIHSRNLSTGIYSEKSKGFLGIREKFGHNFLFEEYHWDTGAPFGTVHPIECIGQCPIADFGLREKENEVFSWVEQETRKYFEDKENGNT